MFSSCLFCMSWFNWWFANTILLTKFSASIDKTYEPVSSINNIRRNLKNIFKYQYRTLSYSIVRQLPYCSRNVPAIFRVRTGRTRSQSKTDSNMKKKLLGWISTWIKWANKNCPILSLGPSDQKICFKMRLYDLYYVFLIDYFKRLIWKLYMEVTQSEIMPRFFIIAKLYKKDFSITEK